MNRQVVIGLSGHIDHGKTALVKSLTGVNTDKLDQEIDRGMTIDIGFAFLTENITMIDVPGHEKFVKNMMSGVSGIDVAILVVAADDGVMPQTREHFEILKLLDVSTGVIVINKIDIADDEWLELVEMDVQELVEGSFLENATIHKVSALNNTGIENLKNNLVSICDSVPPKKDRGIFRMSVDRAFSIKGFGTVATGTVSSGSVQIGKNIEILPSGVKSKIRGLQSHTMSVDEVFLGDRAAINIQSIDIDKVSRGSVICTPNSLSETHKIAAHFHLLSSEKKPLIQNQRVRVHLGTQEVMARVALIDARQLEPNSSAPIMLRLESPLIAGREDKFIIRSYSPVHTIGGGYVLDTELSDKWKVIKDYISKLDTLDKKGQIQLIVENQFAYPITLSRLSTRLTISIDKVKTIIDEDDAINLIDYKRENWVVTNLQRDKIEKNILEYLRKYHELNPYKGGVQKETIRQKIKGDVLFTDFLLESLENQNAVKQSNELWALSSFEIELNKDELMIQDELIHILDKEGFTSSSFKELATKIDFDAEKVMVLLNILEQQGKIIRISGNLMFTKNNFDNLRQELLSHFQSTTTLSVSEFKDLAKTSRKYAVPLLEYFDKLKITYRHENNRKLVT